MADAATMTIKAVLFPDEIQTILKDLTQAEKEWLSDWAEGPITKIKNIMEFLNIFIKIFYVNKYSNPY